MENEKQCTKCKEFKELDQFYFRKESNRYRNECIECYKQIRKNYYLQNKQQVKKRLKVYSDNNKEQLKKYHKEYRIKNREILLKKKRIHGKSKSGRYTTYKTIAKKKKIDFNLSFEQFCELWKQPCFYCGGDIKTIGLDRVDNFKGYCLNNVVTCCYFCNSAKNNLLIDEWIAYLQQLKQFYLCGKYRYVKYNKKIYSLKEQFRGYKRSSKRRGIIFELKFEDFCKFENKFCNYCGSIIENHIGIDRVDNNKGYIENNLVSCCKICNFGKLDLNYDKFIKHLHNLAQCDISKLSNYLGE